MRAPDSGKGRILATPAERDRAATAAIKRDLNEALAAERPEMSPPRTRTPADEALAAAIDELRRADPEWHVAEQCARVAAALSAKDDELGARLTALETVRATVGRTISRLRAWALGSAVTALTAVGAVVYGAGVKAGHASAAELAAKAQAEAVIRHERTLTVELPLLRLSIDHRLDTHDRALGIDTRERMGATP